MLKPHDNCTCFIYQIIVEVLKIIISGRKPVVYTMLLNVYVLYKLI